MEDIVTRLRIMVLLIGAMLTCTPTWATTESEKEYESVEAFLNSLTMQKGNIDLPNGIAALNVPDGFRYIGPGDSKRFLEDAWGNPDGSNQIGMLLPMETDLFDGRGWAVVISYQEDGHVSDKDAEKIDYDDLLKSMQASSEEDNQVRIEEGYEPVTLIGWAAEPHYDRQTKKLYWAKELQFGNNEERVLNYNVRVLGRKGVLVMNAVSGMDQLPMVRERMEQVLSFATFKEGHRYSDFNPGVDKVAAYGIAALIGGKVAAKAGLIAKLGGLLMAFKKVLIIGAVAVVGLLGKLFKRRKTEPTEPIEPAA
jgi:uncharacterized membrane-anchored protein